MDRCSACPGNFHVIHGDGPVPCRVMCVGQNPGKSEEALAVRNELGACFIGQAGAELNDHYIPLAGLTRSQDVYVTNIMKCHTENDRKPTSKEALTCASHFLPAEIEKHQPEIICLMGGVANQLVPSIDLETHNGYPFKVELFGKMQWIFPVYHPASGLHATEMMIPLIDSFKRLRKVLAGDYSTPVNEYPNPKYEDIPVFGGEELYNLLEKRIGLGQAVAIDTETDDGKPWCLTFTPKMGTGYMIRANKPQALDCFNRYLNSMACGVILHNALFDLDVLEKMGVHIDPEMMVDTMQLAYHNADLPLGLKPLGWRLAGMEMDDYNDVVLPYSRDKVMEWLMEAYDISSSVPSFKKRTKRRKIPKTLKAMDKLRLETIGHLKREEGGYVEWDIDVPVDSKLTKDILRIYTHTGKPTRPGSKPYDPWKAWSEIDEEVRRPVTDRLGIMPKASISQVPHDVALRYAAADSDACLRIYPKLLELRKRYEGVVMEHDYDK